MSKHTEGPWIAVGGWVEHPDDAIADICSCYPRALGQEHLDRPYEEVDANARLIAAAPEMLEALKAINTAFQWNEQMARPVFDKVHAAIAKAEGRA
jgi:hypothetical protein